MELHTKDQLNPILSSKRIRSLHTDSGFNQFSIEEMKVNTSDISLEPDYAGPLAQHADLLINNADLLRNFTVIELNHWPTLANDGTMRSNLLKLFQQNQTLF